jgi:hypothetical protein
MTLSTITNLVFLFAFLGFGEGAVAVEVVDVVAAAVEVLDIIPIEGLSTVEEVLIAMKPGLEEKINTSVRHDKPKSALCRNS